MTIVGVSEFSDYPPEAAGLPQVGSYIKPNLEAIIALKPDLVIATADGEKRVEIDRLASLGVAVYIINPGTIAGVVSTVREIGRLSGHEEAGRREGAGDGGGRGPDKGPRRRPSAGDGAVGAQHESPHYRKRQYLPGRDDQGGGWQ